MKGTTVPTDEQIADNVKAMGRAIMQAIDERVDTRTEDGFCDAVSGMVAALICLQHGLSPNFDHAVSFAAMIGGGILEPFANGNSAGIASDMKQRN